MSDRYFLDLGVGPDLVARGIARFAAPSDVALLLCEAAVKQYSLDHYGFHPERHPPLSALLEALRRCEHVKAEVRAILEGVPKEHVYNFLKIPFSPYFWM